MRRPGAITFGWVGVEAEAAPAAVVERHAGFTRDDPRAERVREAVDEGHRVAVAVGHREVAGVAAMLGDQRALRNARPLEIDLPAAHRGVVLGDELLQRPADESRVAGDAVTVLERELLRLDE